MWPDRPGLIERLCQDQKAWSIPVFSKPAGVSAGLGEAEAQDDVNCLCR